MELGVGVGGSSEEKWQSFITLKSSSLEEVVLDHVAEDDSLTLWWCLT